MGLPARFEIVGHDANGIVIRDVGPWDRHLTVTNDAENVVETIAPRLRPGQKLLYYDSYGDLGELRIENGKFAGFG